MTMESVLFEQEDADSFFYPRPEEHGGNSRLYPFHELSVMYAQLLPINFFLRLKKYIFQHVEIFIILKK